MSNPFVRKLEAHTRLPIERRREIETLTSRAQLLGPRADIVPEGEEFHVVNVMLSGWACRHKVLRDGRRQITALFLPGDVCGSHVLFPGGPKQNLITLTPTIVARVSAAAIRATMTAHPDLAEALWCQMMVVADVQREWTVCIGRLSALERTAHLLCEIWERMDIVGLTDGQGCDIPLAQHDLADAMGLSTVHLNRSLVELRSRGLIRLHNKRLVIPDQRKLAELAMFDPVYLHRRGA